MFHILHLKATDTAKPNRSKEVVFRRTSDIARSVPKAPFNMTTYALIGSSPAAESITPPTTKANPALRIGTKDLR
jgi:hypothetical protein